VWRSVLCEQLTSNARIQLSSDEEVVHAVAALSPFGQQCAFLETRRVKVDTQNQAEHHLEGNGGEMDAFIIGEKFEWKKRKWVGHENKLLA
jgi:hypothetical protein